MRKLGFTYATIDGLPLAVFKRVTWGKVEAVAASELMNAHNRVFRDMLSRLRR